MEKKQHVPGSSSSSDDSSSNEEEATEQHVVLNDRKMEKINDKKAANAAAQDEDEEEEDEEEEEDDDGDVNGTQRGTAYDNTEEASSSGTMQAGQGDGDSNSTSETSSASEGKPGKPSHHFFLLPHKAENTNRHGKKAPTAEKPSKVRPPPETSPKKSKGKTSKRDRDVDPQEKGSTKKQKKESSDKPSKMEKVSKEGSIVLTGEKKMNAKKSAHADTMLKNSQNSPPQQNRSKNPDNASAQKEAQKSRNDKRTAKDTESQPLKESGSPTKPKTFTPKDELVLTKEILRDIKQGVEIPVRKDDGYWSKLDDRVKGRMEGAWTKEQLCQKVKRMKVRYTTMAEKFKNSTEHKFRNSTDNELFGLWDQIWGGVVAMHVGHEREVSEVKDKQQPKVLVPASPVKGGKVSHSKVVSPIRHAKFVLDESEGPKSKHTKKQSSNDDDDDNDDNENEESDGEGDLDKKDVPVTSAEVDCKDMHVEFAPVEAKGNVVQGHNYQSHLFSDAHKLFPEEIQAALTELQESSKQTLKEWQSKALVVVENAVKAFADQLRLIDVSGFGGLFTPFGGLNLMESQRVDGDTALQQQWHELRLKELDVYHQKLELMQRECQLKQDQLKLQFRRKK